jgi:predicted nucleotidyltransferase
MIDIEKAKLEIIERLKPLNPDRVILFGSYAYGTPNEDSDIDLFLLKDNLDLEDRREYEINASIMIYDLIKKYNIGFDILSAPTTYIETREDYFYKVDILENGKVIYE